GQVDQEIALALAATLFLLLITELQPRRRGHVLEAAAVPGVGGDLVREVVVTEGDVIPLRRGELLPCHLRAAERVRRLGLPAHDSIDVAVRDRYVDRGAALRAQCRPLAR